MYEPPVGITGTLDALRSSPNEDPFSYFPCWHVLKNTETKSCTSSWIIVLVASADKSTSSEAAGRELAEGQDVYGAHEYMIPSVSPLFNVIIDPRIMLLSVVLVLRLYYF